MKSNRSFSYFSHKNLTKVSLALFELDMNDKLNKKLIGMLVRKRFFADESYDCVVVQLIKYGKELLELNAGQPVIKRGKGFSFSIDSEGRMVRTYWNE